MTQEQYNRAVEIKERIEELELRTITDRSIWLAAALQNLYVVKEKLKKEIEEP